MDEDTLLQELPSDIECFRRFSRPFSRCTSTSRNIHQTMRLLEQIFDPYGSCIARLRNVLLLSLDLEHDYEKIHQIGISTLDVAKITQVNTELPQSISDLVSNHLYLLQSDTIKRGHCEYRYGEVKPAKNMTVEEILSIFIGSPGKTEQPRNIVLIGHSIDGDIRTLKRNGFDIKDVSNIVSTIDLAPIASYLLHDSSKLLTLRQVCRRLNIRSSGFHNAGNDSLYTLQALLLLFSQYKLQKETAASMWNVLTPNGIRERERALIWQCQIDAIKYIANQFGAVFWTISARQKKRKQCWLQKQNRDRESLIATARD